MTARLTQLDIVRTLSDSERDALMRSGTAPRLGDLVGFEFAGINCGALVDLIGIRKFKKGFYDGAPRVESGPTPYVQGYNIDVVQDGMDNPHRARPSESSPKRYGFYRVHNVQPDAKDNVYPNAVLLDYGLGANGLAVTALLRDYLVQVYPDDPDLFLGRAFLALLGTRPHAGYFVLQRTNAHTFRG